MSYISNPNQPIVFGSLPEANCDACGDGTSKQLVDVNDELFFQLEAQPCTDELAISNQSAIVWTSAAGRVCGDADAFGIYSFNFTTTEVFRVFKVQIVVNTLTSGELTIHIQGGDSYTFYTAGTYEIYLSSDVAANGDLTPQIYLNGASFVGCFSSAIRVYGVGTDISVAWVEADTLAFISEVDSVITVVDNYVTVALDMASQSVEGCARLAITDGCNPCNIDRICNQEFITDAGCWNATGPDNWQLFPSGQATIEGDGLTPAAYLFENPTEICIGTTYIIDYTLTACEGGNTFRLQGFDSSAIRNTAGTYSETLVANSTTLKFRAGIVGAGLIAVESFSIRTAPSSLTFTQYSNVLSIGEYDDCGKFLKIGGCNAANQFGLAFSGTSFLPSVRVEGIRYKPQYDVDVDSFRSASGNWTANYVDRRKKWTFHFGRVPENVLDFLSVVLFFDNCYINDELYFPANDEFPQIDWNDADNKFGRFDIEMYEKKNKVTKVLCTTGDADCLPSILDTSDEPFLLTEGLERITTESGTNIYW